MEAAAGRLEFPSLSHHQVKIDVGVDAGRNARVVSFKLFSGYLLRQQDSKIILRKPAAWSIALVCLFIDDGKSRIDIRRTRVYTWPSPLPGESKVRRKSARISSSDFSPLMNLG